MDKITLKQIIFYIIFIILFGFGICISNMITQPIYSFLNIIWSRLLLGKNKAKEYTEWENTTWTDMILGKGLDTQTVKGKEILSTKKDIFFFGKNLIVILQLLLTSLIFALLTTIYNKFVHLDINVLIGIFVFLSWLRNRRYTSMFKMLLYIGSYYFFAIALLNKWQIK